MLRLAVYNKEPRVPWHLDNECKDRLSLLLQIVGILREVGVSQEVMDKFVEEKVQDNDDIRIHALQAVSTL